MPRPYSNIDLLDSEQYIADLTRQVSQAKMRICITGPIFTDDSSTHELIEALLAAAERGVMVSIAADTFTYGELGGFFSPVQRFRKPVQDAMATAKKFKESGASFIWLADIYKFNPFAGITHIKWAVVDEKTCYIFGGVNLYKLGIDSADYMFRITDPALATQIAHQQTLIVAHDPLNSSYAGYKDTWGKGTLYIDSGVKHQSLIYDRAIELASQAEEILCVSQYCPSGPLAKQLKQTKTTLYFNPPNNAPLPHNLLIQWDMIREGLKTQYTRKKYLHAKFMIFTMPGGKKIALTGSHNFSHAGVVFGTREVALETKDITIIRQLESFFHTHVS
ncbi:MAG TPA: phosphatidylserine/phosphatidylglycerophosphate/cardiolipin synthase family protein [Candidatus Saccharimonadales bacterium]|nr:phosphatidylserine/phosphatidylglycerophosphate/cardiolipin synthase family protein [Candidatus Saccharimonadales bacterium]